ncbi:MAG: energy transducer TonB [Cyclobacteriaceae bacterium]|nr:energy transducer TonB [Cyclobacteriaceae bacterium]
MKKILAVGLVLFLFSSLVMAQTNNVYTIVDEPPTPVGGTKDFYAYIGKNINYPSTARSSKIQGKVLIQFIVNEDGSLSDHKMIKGIGGGCDEEALRVIKNAPKWIPGKQNGKAVKVRKVMPVMFQLN